MILRLFLSIAVFSLGTLSSTLLAHDGPGACKKGDPECSSWSKLIEYPEWARLEGVEGTITLQTRVDLVGHAFDCVILESSGYPRLDESACEQFESVAHFNPALDEDGNPVIGSFCIMITWRFTSGQPASPRSSAFCKGGFAAVLGEYLPYNPDSVPLAELREGIETAHPAESIFYANRLIDLGRQEEALFWYYAGFLRWNTRLACREFELGGEGAAFGALNRSIGWQTSQWGRKNFDAWMSGIDNVHAWDLATPQRFAEDQSCTRAAQLQRTDLLNLKKQIQEIRGEIEILAAD